MSDINTDARERELWAAFFASALPKEVRSVELARGLGETLAAALPALGYVKAETEEWGYRRYPGYPINPCHLRATAELALGSTAECTVERRVVGYGPWEVVVDASE